MKLSRCTTLLGAILVASALSAGCHEEGDVKVASLKFEGNRAFKSGQLSNLMVTQSTGWLPWARRHYFNREVFDRDMESLVAFKRAGADGVLSYFALDAARQLR